MIVLKNYKLILICLYFILDIFLLYEIYYLIWIIIEFIFWYEWLKWIKDWFNINVWYKNKVCYYEYGFGCVLVLGFY